MMVRASPFPLLDVSEPDVELVGDTQELRDTRHGIKIHRWTVQQRRETGGFNAIAVRFGDVRVVSAGKLSLKERKQGVKCR